MAGDWMKVEKATPDKPEIAILARKLNCSQGEAFLNWFRVYVWADGITQTGRVPFLSPSEGDTLSRACPGTCAALASKEIGWLRISETGITFGNWTRHNGKNAKSRVLEAEKKRKQREKCPDDNGTKAGLEKRREEVKKENTKRKKPAFQKPTLEQVAAYCLERNNGIDAQKFINHYDRVGWVVGRNKTPMKDWQAAVRTWEDERKPKAVVSRVTTDDDDARWNPVDGGLAE